MTVFVVEDTPNFCDEGTFGAFFIFGGVTSPIAFAKGFRNDPRPRLITIEEVVEQHIKIKPNSNFIFKDNRIRHCWSDKKRHDQDEALVL